MSEPLPTVAVLGASGLIGEAAAFSLMGEGFPVAAIARRFTAAQKAAFGAAAVECPVVGLDAPELARLLDDAGADIVVNCIGVLQDGRQGTADAVHRGFAASLVAALDARVRAALLVHVSIPGEAGGDRTAFSRTKRAAEREIAAGPVPFVILRPGFVVAPAAFGASALIRALAMLPVGLPRREAVSPFACTDIGDIASTVAVLARRWQAGERRWSEIWEVMARQPTSFGDVVEAFRGRLGGPAPRLRLASGLLTVGAFMGDLARRLGWSPPVCTTALAETRRGVAGDPGPWIDATGIEPAPLGDMLRRVPATVQEKWFARLYLAKPVAIASLVFFWVLSGLIALTVAFDAATAILTAHGFPDPFARMVTAASSLADIAVGLAIAFRKTCRAGLIAGIAVALFYMGGAAVITPDMWVEPLGALVKTVPAIVLMLVALATLEER